MNLVLEQLDNVVRAGGGEVPLWWAAVVPALAGYLTAGAVTAGLMKRWLRWAYPGKLDNRDLGLMLVWPAAVVTLGVVGSCHLAYTAAREVLASVGWLADVTLVALARRVAGEGNFVAGEGGAEVSDAGKAEGLPEPDTSWTAELAVAKENPAGTVYTATLTVTNIRPDGSAVEAVHNSMEVCQRTTTAAVAAVAEDGPSAAAAVEDKRHKTDGTRPEGTAKSPTDDIPTKEADPLGPHITWVVGEALRLYAAKLGSASLSPVQIGRCMARVNEAAPVKEYLSRPYNWASMVVGLLPPGKESAVAGEIIKEVLTQYANWQRHVRGLVDKAVGGLRCTQYGPWAESSKVKVKWALLGALGEEGLKSSYSKEDVYALIRSVNKLLPASWITIARGVVVGAICNAWGVPVDYSVILEDQSAGPQGRV